MDDITNMSEREIQEIVDVCKNELDRRKRVHLTATANKALSALEELVKVSPDCYVDMNNDMDWDEDPVHLYSLVKQWKAQNFHFD